jgi:hypothetical protein
MEQWICQPRQGARFWILDWGFWIFNASSRGRPVTKDETEMRTGADGAGGRKNREKKGKNKGILVF